MTGTRAAVRYAKAILSLAQEQNVANEVNGDMKIIRKTIADNKELQAFLQSPVIKSDIKKASLKEIFSTVNSATTGLIDVLIDNKRVGLLEATAEKYMIQYDLVMGKQVAKVTTAIPLTKELESKILAKVKELTGNEATIENTVDESILGGFILRVGDLQYNASVAQKLQNLKRELIYN
ncbi:MAG: ATP synthase F1 subunit delta [Flavobacteriaceae bacterium]|nr:ATP synthase F1 subunit delta [Flavobacteriaceae bacterium]